MDAKSGGLEDTDESLSFGVLVHAVMPSELTDQFHVILLLMRFLLPTYSNSEMPFDPKPTINVWGGLRPIEGRTYWVVVVSLSQTRLTLHAGKGLVNCYIHGVVPVPRTGRLQSDCSFHTLHRFIVWAYPVMQRSDVRRQRRLHHVDKLT